MRADRNARTRAADDRTEANRQIRHLAERAGVDPTSLIDSGATVEHARSFIMESLIQRSAAAPLSAYNRSDLGRSSQPRRRHGRGPVREGDAFLSAIGSGCPVYLWPHHPRNGA